jgi:hypothetical protein
MKLLNQLLDGRGKELPAFAPIAALAAPAQGSRCCPRQA